MNFDEWLTPKEAILVLGIKNKNGLVRKRGKIDHRWCPVISGYRYRKTSIIAYMKMIQIRRILAAKRKLEVTEKKPRPPVIRTFVKLTEEDVLEIRASPDKVAKLAKRYRVSKTAIRDVLLGRRWKDVGGRIRSAEDFGGTWGPTPDNFAMACKSMREYGTWSAAGDAAGVASGTIRKFAHTDEGRALLYAKREYDAARVSLDESDRALLIRAIDARKTVQSWQDVPSKVGITNARLTSLRAKYANLRPSMDAASLEGRANHERDQLRQALAMLEAVGTWRGVAHAMGIGPESLTRWRKRHPDLDAQMTHARRRKTGWTDVGFLYVVVDGHGVVKVGRTTHLEKRLLTIKRGNSSGHLECLYSVHLAQRLGETEHAIHNRLLDYRVHGEWFKVSNELAVRVAREEVAKAGEPVQMGLL